MQPELSALTNVRISRRGTALVVALDRPADDNRIDRKTLDGLVEALRLAESDESLSVVVITGSGNRFCSGSRIDGYVERTSSMHLAFARSFCALQDQMAQLSIPILAAINGACLAGGMSILAAADMAIASDDALFGYPEVKAGLFPLLAMAVAHPILPPKVALELFYTGRVVTAAEALHLNLVNRVVGASRLWEEVDTVLASLPQARSTALTLGRRAYFAMKLMSPAARLEYAQAALVTLLSHGVR